MSSLTQIYKYKFAKSGNILIYFLQRIPLVKRLFKDTLYRQSTAKTIMGIIGMIVDTISNIFLKAMIAAILIIVPILVVTKESNNMPIFATCYVFFVIGTSITADSLFGEQTSSYQIIHILKMPPKEYFFAKYFINLVYMVIGFDAVFIIAGFLYGINPVMCAFLGMLVPFINIFFCALNLFIYTKNPGFLKKHFVVVVIAVFSVFIGIALLMLGAFIPGYIIFNPIFILVALALSIVSLIYMYKMDGEVFKQLFYGLYSKQNMIKDSSMSKADALFSSVKLNKVKNSVKVDTKLEKYHGFEYLNQLFFKRHRRMICKGMLIRIVFVLIASVGLLLVGLFLKNKISLRAEYLGNIIGVVVFIMYYLMLGDQLNKALFHNCDVAFLHYNYYREKRVILSNFWFRFKKLLVYNILITLAIDICLSIFVHFFSFGVNTIEYVLLIGITFMLCVFFTIYHLFMYYILQPYTADMEAKNPFFSLVSCVVYFLAYACLNAEFDGSTFALVIFVATLVFDVFAFALIYFVSYKTFKLRK